MCKKLFITLLIVTLTISYSEAGSLRGRSSGYGSNQQQPTKAAAISPKEYLDKKSGFSTFGIIALIFVVIVSCLAFYYGIICYPFLCRDEKKYHFMDVSSTMTSATSRSIQSIENYPDEQKHGQISDIHNYK